MRVELSKVPEDIRDQFGSEQTTALLSDINDRLYISNLRAIPRLLFILETKELPAHDFVKSMIEEAKITEKEAGAVAKEIKEKILEPMRYSLFRWGIDISDIKTGDAPSLKDIAPEGGENKLEEKNIDITEIGEEDKNVSVPIQKEPPITPARVPAPAPLSDAPFIIHEEKKTETAGAGRTAFKGFSIPLGFFKSKDQPAEAGQPVRASIEAPAKSEKRVVNYSELRTSLSPFEGAQNFINPKSEAPRGASGALSGGMDSRVPTIEFHEGEGKIPGPAPMPMPKSGTEEKRADPGKADSIIGTIKRPEPKIEGNVINLKN